jgi:hypothetical protein
MVQDLTFIMVAVLFAPVAAQAAKTVYGFVKSHLGL